jgi:hypothetical protein
MFKDPIVEEVRKNRETLAAKFKNDIKAIISDAKKRQNKAKTIDVTANKINRPKHKLPSS